MSGLLRLADVNRDGHAPGPAARRAVACHGPRVGNRGRVRFRITSGRELADQVCSSSESTAQLFNSAYDPESEWYDAENPLYAVAAGNGSISHLPVLVAYGHQQVKRGVEGPNNGA
jgi:hypothetical protein